MKQQKTFCYCIVVALTNSFIKITMPFVDSTKLFSWGYFTKFRFNENNFIESSIKLTKQTNTIERNLCRNNNVFLAGNVLTNQMLLLIYFSKNISVSDIFFISSIQKLKQVDC